MLYLEAFLTCALVAWACNALELISWRRSAAFHWTERARRLHPARASRQLNIWMIPLTATVLAYRFDPDDSWMLVFLCGFLGTLLGNYPMDRDTHYGLAFRPWAHQVAAGVLLKFPGYALYLAAIILMPREWNWTVLAVAVLFVAVQLALLYGLSLRMMRWLRLLRPASPRLQRIVDEVSAAQGVKVSATWELAQADANAVAFVTTNQLAFTDGLLVFCPDDELRAICAHEIGHLSEDRLTLAGRVLGSLVLMPLIFINPLYGTWGLWGIAGLAVGLCAAVLAIPRFVQAMEKRADRIAHTSSPDTTVYARALEHLHRVNFMPATQPKTHAKTHPDLYDRMLAAGLTPDYHRPAPPSTNAWTSMAMTVLCVLSALQFFDF